MEKDNSRKEVNRYRLRKASLEDAFCLFTWKNDPENLKSSHHDKPVSFNGHVEWLNAVLENPMRQLWILEDQQNDVGMLRLDFRTEIIKSGKERTKKIAEISYSVAKEYRGKGYGEVLLRMAEEQAALSEVEILYGEVLFHNKISQRLFRKLGYVEKRKDHFTSFKKAINTIFIRTDMNETIATGHVMRCLSIADAAAKKGKKTIFISADEHPEELICSRGHSFINLDREWNQMDKESEKLIPVLQEYGAGRLLIDSYQVTYDYLEEVRKVTEIFYLDDLDQFKYPVQNLICYANYYRKLSYGAYSDRTKFYLGTSYLPLREVYQNRNRKDISSKISHVLLLSGGSDPLHMTDRLLPVIMRKMEGKGNSIITVICGKLYHGFDDLCKRYEEKNGSDLMIRILQDVSHPEIYMEEADLAVSAGGTTLYELSAMGVPTITYSFADNQLQNVKQFMEDGLMDYAGDGRNTGVEEKLEDYFDLLEKDIDLRKKRSEAMQQLVDGRGAERIADLL